MPYGSPAGGARLDHDDRRRIGHRPRPEHRRIEHSKERRHETDAERQDEDDARAEDRLTADRSQDISDVLAEADEPRDQPDRAAVLEAAHRVAEFPQGRAPRLGAGHAAVNEIVDALGDVRLDLLRELAIGSRAADDLSPPGHDCAGLITLSTPASRRSNALTLRSSCLRPSGVSR